MNAAAVHAASNARLILVAVDDDSDQTYAPMMDAAIALAKETGADLLLYDRSAESYLVDPYPYPEVLDDSAPISTGGVRSLGRAYLAEKIEAAAEAGVMALAWLPRATGAAEMARCVNMFHAGAAVLPEELATPSLFDRVRGNTLRRFREGLAIPILLVAADGELVADAANAVA